MRTALSLCLALLAPAAAAAAQPAPSPAPSDPPELLVEGIPVDLQVKRFVEALTRTPEGDQFARFEDPVCPRVAGLGAADNAAVAARIRRVAAAANMRVADAPCIANLILFVAPQKKAAMNALWERSPGMFGDRSEGEVRDLAAKPGPVAVWKNMSLIDAQGARLAKDNGMDAFYLTKTVGTPSRLNPVTRPYVAAAMILVEAEALRGISNTQLADFAVMRAFAEVDPAAEPRPLNPTIATLVQDAAAGRAVPLSLTHWDLSFLKSLNATSGPTVAHLQRPLIERLLKKELEEAEGGRN